MGISPETVTVLVSMVVAPLITQLIKGLHGTEKLGQTILSLVAAAVGLVAWWAAPESGDLTGYLLAGLAGAGVANLPAGILHRRNARRSTE